ncbi:hypothetical protein [Hymenobacter sp. B81]|uniref:hypothetical protein n=1 Tax=Hymenobacter sp. B81 TaxID=3344878 RepID=UPI0037DC9137
MTFSSFAFRPLLLFLLVLLSAAGLSSCKDADNSESAPHFKFTDAQKVWAAPYQKPDVWVFRDSTVNERRYQPVNGGFQEISVGEANSRNILYYREAFQALLQRTDSTFQVGIDPDSKLPKYRFQVLMASSVDPNLRRHDETFQLGLDWSNTIFYVPVEQFEAGTALPAGWRLLPQITFFGTTYQNVLEYTAPVPTPPARPTSWDAVRVYYTKARGVIRFEERGGKTWDRM